MATKKKGWGFDPRNIDGSVRPQDDLYHYAVGGWLKNNKIPAAESRWGAFHILRHKTDAQLHALLESVAKKQRVAPGSPEQMIRDLYRSGMDMETRTAHGLSPLAGVRARIAALDDRSQLVELVAYLHRIGVGAFWSSGVDQDFKNADKNVFHIAQGGLGMPDRDYYLKDGEEQKRVRDAYLPHLRAMFALMGYGAKAGEAAEAVLKLETALARASMKREDMRDADKLHHPYSVTKLQKLTPGISWKGYLARIGADVKAVNVMQPDFLVGVDRLLATASLEEVRWYLDWHTVGDFASLLSPKFIKQHFSFYGTTLSGQKQMRPLWRRVLGVVNGSLGHQLGKLYVDAYFTPAAKRKANELVDNLVTAFALRIEQLDWMTPATKKKALKKLRAMARKIAYPDTWKSYPGLAIRPGDYVGNVMRVTEYEHRRDLKKLTKPVDRKEWYDYPQTVNAFYSPTMNDMLFPAAFLQHPFFDADADDALNYACLGMAIGHEMTHGFDDSGAKFDEKGNLKNWWSATDKKQFEKKAQVVKRQFDQYVVAGLSVNGKLTLGENIADLGGLSIAYDGYQKHLEQHGRADIDGLTPEQRFFLAFAQCEVTLARPEVQKLQILTDPHAPSETRVNGPLSNMPEFYAAFGVRKGDALYRSSAQRAKIW